MAQYYDLNNTGPEVQERLDKVTENETAIKDETKKRTDEDNDMKKDIAALQDAVWPITLTLSVTFGNGQHTASFTVKEKGENFVPDTLLLTKTLADSTVKTLTEAPAASGGFASAIDSNREIFKLEVGKEGRTPKSASVTRYVCYAGGSAEAEIDAGKMGALTMYSSGSVAFNPSVSTADGQYIWLVVPSYLTINRVTSAGFDVTLEAARTVTTPLGTFKAYRSVNPLTAQTWNLVIS